MTTKTKRITPSAEFEQLRRDEVLGEWSPKVPAPGTVSGTRTEWDRLVIVCHLCGDKVIDERTKTYDARRDRVFTLRAHASAVHHVETTHWDVYDWARRALAVRREDADA